MQAAQGLLGNVQREPGYIYGDILPVRAQVNQQGQVIPGSREWGLGYSNAARGLLDAFTLPGRAMAGEQVTPQQAMEMAMNVTAPGVATARYTPGLLNMPMVYHGTPHRFEPTPDNPLGEFRASQIGTGEGAQMYGHGIYVAESPEVAAGYRKSLSPDYIKVSDSALQAAANEFKKSGYSYEDAISGMRQAYKDSDEKELISAVAQTYNIPTGSLYTADLPDEMVGRMLDWDKPISEQPQEIRALINKTKSMLPANALDDLGGDLSLLYGKDVTPSQFLNTWEALAGFRGAGEKALREAGVPGVKYLDAGSRGDKAKPTRNFVLFPGEERKAKIIKRE